MNCPGNFNGSTTEECVKPESDTADNGELAIPLQRRLTRESRVTKPQDRFLLKLEYYDQGNIMFLGLV
jgi:hypothetical protein